MKQPGRGEPLPFSISFLSSFLCHAHTSAHIATQSGTFQGQNRDISGTIRDILEAIRDILGTFQGHFSLTFVPDLATKKLLRQSKAAKIKPVISTRTALSTIYFTILIIYCIAVFQIN